MLRNAENTENTDCDPLTISPTDASSSSPNLTHLPYENGIDDFVFEHWPFDKIF